MIIRFRENCLQELYETGNTKASKYKTLCRNKALVEGYQRAVDNMAIVDCTEDLKQISFLHYEKLKHNTGENLSSIRIKNGAIERLIFTEFDGGIEVELIEINDTHYGNKR